MDDLVRQGKVRYLGCSNFRAFQVCKALWISDKHNLARWDIIQPPFNLLARDIEYELLPLCVEEGIGVAVFSPMAAGFLSGKYEKGKPPIEGRRFTLGHFGFVYHQKYWNELDFNASFYMFIRGADGPAWSENLGGDGDYFVIMPGWDKAMRAAGAADMAARYQARYNGF